MDHPDAQRIGVALCSKLTMGEQAKFLTRIHLLYEARMKNPVVRRFVKVIIQSCAITFIVFAAIFLFHDVNLFIMCGSCTSMGNAILRDVGWFLLWMLILCWFSDM